MIKRLKQILLFIVILVVTSSGLDEAAGGEKSSAEKNGIAVVRGRYDDIEVVLHNFKINYDLLELRDLEDLNTIKKYHSIFIPSGIDYPIEASINVLAHLAHYKAVTLKSDFYEVNKKQIVNNIKKYVTKGGAIYCSGYSFKYLQDAFCIFKFFDNFPYMGMPGRIESSLKNDLERFCMKNKIVLYMNHPGWIAIRSVENSEVIASASYETPRGSRSGPVSIIARRGSGEILYTCYDSTVFSLFRRFNVYRIAGASLLSGIYTTVDKWRQKVTGRIVDSIHRGEYSRIYRIDITEGVNTIYFSSNKNFYQIDILDSDMSILESRDLSKREQIFTIESKKRDFCFVKIYPSTEDRYGLFAIVSAQGKSIFPYLFQSVCILIAFIIIVTIVVTIKLFGRKKYSGRFRYMSGAT